MTYQNNFSVFGRVFDLKDQTYVYLASSSDAYYFARLWDSEHEVVKDLLKLEERLSRSGRKHAQDKLNKPMFCYVRLTTKEFQQCLAHFGDPKLGVEQIEKVSLKIHGMLNSQDLNELKTNIELSSYVLPRPLVEAIKELDLVEK